MAKKKLILLHGMGQHSAASFKDEFIKCAEAALGFYPSFAKTKITDHVDVVAVEYNDIFDKHRQVMSDRAQSVHDRLVTIGGPNSIVEHVVAELSDLEREFGGDGFFDTHWLDVLFYRFTVLGERVRIKVGQAIAQEIERTQGGAADVHILGHSLGTAVLHDTLAKLYTPDYILGDDTHNLSTAMHTLGSVHMVANVSRVLETFAPVKKSVVRPGEGGCTAFYLQSRHVLDPLTRLRPFMPTDNGGWISSKVWNQQRYRAKEPTSITHGNPHSLHHYLLNPLVHTDLFTLLFDFSPKKKESEEALQLYQEMTLHRRADQLEDTLENLSLSDRGSVRDFIKAAIALKNFVQGLGEPFNI